MRNLILRLDDACPMLNTEKWYKIEQLCDKYNVKPLVGLIPDCKDRDMLEYKENNDFWYAIIQRWKEKGWEFALHGYEHVFHTCDGGINPVNNRSEFAGVPLQDQKTMIRNGLSLLKRHGINPNVFFAPAHTFDNNTLIALKTETNIRIISDTISFDSYYYDGFYYVPQQSGKARNLPFKTITFCYHPNLMSDKDFSDLESFLSKNVFSTISSSVKSRKKSILDRLVSYLYFKRRSKKR